MSEILRSAGECAYCGWTGDTRDHVPCLASFWLGKRTATSRRAGQRWDQTVPACRECNCTLGASPLLSIRERAETLTVRYERKYRKLLQQPVWSEEEVERLGPAMRDFVKAKAVQRQILMDRLSHLGTISRFGAETLGEYWERVTA